MNIEYRVLKKNKKNQPDKVYQAGLSFNQIIAYLNGAEYRIPPSDHSALTPRAIPIGVLRPMLRSKLSE